MDDAQISVDEDWFTEITTKIPCISFHSEQNLRKYANILSDWVQKYSWLATDENTRFWTENLWEKVPSTWKDPLIQTDTIQLQQLTKGYYHESWPEDLKEFIRFSSEISLGRTALPYLEGKAPDKVSINKMSEKKVHEVIRMSKFTDSVCKSCNCNILADIGAGEGKISQFLAQQYKLNVIAVEANDEFIEMGQQRVDKLTKVLQKRKDRKDQTQNSSESNDNNNATPTVQSKLKFMPFVFNPDNLGAFQEKVQVVLDNICQGNENPNRNFTIIGLHTCGNLAKMVMDTFLNSEAVALINVGCCYHLLTDNGTMISYPQDTTFCFGYSEFIKAKNLQFSGQTMKTATQANYTYAKLPPDDPAVSGITLAYRAIIDSVLKARFTSEDYRVKRINLEHYNNFESYLGELLKRFALRDPQTRKWNLQPQLLQDLLPEFRKSYERHATQFKGLTAWIALQMVMGPVVESLILVDRLLYLYERGVHPVIAPLFDPEVSPRNMAVIAFKPHHEESIQHLKNMNKTG